MKKITMILFMVTLLSSCVDQIEIRGNKPETAVVDEIEIGMSKADVVKRIGSPSVVPAFSKETWIYIGSKMNRKAFFDPVEEDRQVLYIKFNIFDMVSEIETKEMSDGMKVAFSKEKTPTLGQSLGVMKQILGNIGRFNQQ